MTDQSAGVGEAQSSPPRRRRYSTKLAHPTFSIEACPREECGFPEADGGFCPECGWVRFTPSCPHCQMVDTARTKRKGKDA